MRKVIYTVTLLLLGLVVVSCNKYTDITPKGKNLLDRATDLDLLMNVEYSGGGFDFARQSLLINDMYPQAMNVPNIISGTVKDMNYALLRYDETIDRAALTATDGMYENLYKIIANVANIVLTNADKASGDVQLLNQLKAEARVVRAYLHYLLVNTYARAYDPATAATDGGIPYVDNINFETVHAKNTVKEVYDKMVADINAAIESNALPDYPKNNMRCGKGFAYAFKARLLLSMRDYKAALAAANEGLKYNSTLEDHRPFLPVADGGQGLPVSRDGMTAADNLFYAFNGKAWPNTFSPTYEILNEYYETGNILKDHTDTYNYMYGEMFSGLTGIPIFYAIMYQQNAAGLTTSDLYFAKAESLIRQGDIAGGMQLINQVRLRRVYPYTAVTAASEAEAMTYLQKASRIEFLFTWRNFVDIKRWNREGKYTVVTKRTINSNIFTLSPTSPMWVFPFPQSATNFNETLTQNY